MVVDRRLVGLRRLGNLADRAALETLGRENVDGGFDQAVSVPSTGRDMNQAADPVLHRRKLIDDGRTGRHEVRQLQAQIFAPCEAGGAGFAATITGADACAAGRRGGSTSTCARVVGRIGGITSTAAMWRGFAASDRAAIRVERSSVASSAVRVAETG